MTRGGYVRRSGVSQRNHSLGAPSGCRPECTLKILAFPQLQRVKLHAHGTGSSLRFSMT